MYKKQQNKENDFTSGNQSGSKYNLKSEKTNFQNYEKMKQKIL